MTVEDTTPSAVPSVAVPLVGVVSRLFDLISHDSDRSRFSELLSEGGRYHSAPSNLFEGATSRTFAEAIDSWVAGRARLLDQSYEITDAMEAESTAAVRFRWSGTLAGDIPSLPAGTRLVTDSVGLYRFAGRRIVRMDLWDSYIHRPD